MDFGFVVGTGRDLGGDGLHWNINVMLMPFHKIISSVPHAAHIWMPIDDENTMLYSIDFNPTGPLTEEQSARSRSWHGIHTENVPGTDHATMNKDNDYLIDRQLQASGESFTGMRGLAIQDCAIQESMGPVADRTQEHLWPATRRWSRSASFCCRPWPTTPRASRCRASIRPASGCARPATRRHGARYLPMRWGNGCVPTLKSARPHPPDTPSKKETRT